LSEAEASLENGAMTKAEQRQRVVADFEQSGLSRREYCAKHRLSVSTLDNWRRRVGATRHKQFVRVELSHARLPGRLSLVLTNGRRIETETGFDERELTRLIRAAESGLSQ
jgi:transposase-like protein